MDRGRDMAIALRKELSQTKYGPEKTYWSIITDPVVLTKDYAIDRSHHTPHAPIAAVIPTTTLQVCAIARVCYENNCAMVVRGGGTGLEGASIPYGDKTIVIDMQRFQKFELDEANQHCWVGVGVTKMALNKLLNKRGFLFGPDPASNPCVGGMASTSGSGMSTIKYGTMRENVVSLRVVTPQGEDLVTRRTVRKSSTGLDLTNVFVGSEGTLGIITEVCVKIHKLQRCHVGGYATFKSSKDACAAVVHLRQHLKHITTLVRCELLNPGGIMAANKEFKLNLEAVPTLLLELENDLVEDKERKALRADFDVLVENFKKFGAVRAEFYPTPEGMDKIWEARRGCLLAAYKYRQKKGERVYNTDTCVPLSELARCLDETEKDFEQNGMLSCICAHIADGNFHCMIPFNNDEEKRAVAAIADRLSERALKLGGTVSGEHGVGIGKVKHLLGEHGKTHIALQEKIKYAIDPKGLMNPGKFYPSEQAKHRTAHL